MTRDRAVELASRSFHLKCAAVDSLSPVERFQKRVFSRSVMRRMLPGDVYENVANAMDGKGKICPEFADTIATAMKEWAISLGATHYSHWFQPLTGAPAEKHDSFLDWGDDGTVIAQFNGCKLIQGEPDASSFPSGGLRSTYEARGYTGWDPKSPPFVWEGGDGLTLCIPSVFFSWTGAVLDMRIPLHRSDDKLNQAVLRLLHHTGTIAEQVHSNVGCEQEYFIIDRALRSERPDLLLSGRTVFGAPPPKGQELEDHYFGVVKDRILHFMQDFEESALELGIPIKTRHNEVAPAQHEAAPSFERAILNLDHNLLLMELMRQIAAKHDLACLLHEKPFAGINGSGKHVNWSLATDAGVNLLDPHGKNSLQFVFLMTAILNGVHRHADLLRASVASRSNDFRLGSHEAPPAIVSVYLGQELEALLDAIEGGTEFSGQGRHSVDLGIPHIPELPRDNTDRNRTSPFAFTGNKFEYRAVGSSVNAAGAVTVLNLVVAESLQEMLDATEAARKGSSGGGFAEAARPVIQRYLKQCKPVRFSGNSYAAEWTAEAKRRGLPNLVSSPESFNAYLTPKAHQLFRGVLAESELQSRYEIANETYSKTVNIEARLCIDLFHTAVLPAAARHQAMLANSVQAVKQSTGRPASELTNTLSTYHQILERAQIRCRELEEKRQQATGLEGAQQAIAFCEQVAPACAALREEVDRLEMLTEDGLWSLPKYRELLFLV